MELNFSELDKVNTMNPYETFDSESYNRQNEINYWEKSQQKNEVKKKKVSFNDILSNMNLVVNNQGVLQFMTPNFKKNEDIDNNQQNYNNQYDSYQNNLNQNNLSQNKRINEPIDQSIKHSYIYNKYFKDYANSNNEIPVPRVPKTIEEYHQMLLDDKIKAIQHKQRIEQIKSKKMLFTTNPGMTLNPKNIQASKNNLHRMSFR